MRTNHPLKLTLAAGRGKYVVMFDSWNGKPLAPDQVRQIRASLDRALLAVNVAAVQDSQETPDPDAR